MHTPSFKNAHPVARQWMDEDFYYSPMEESAPFGSDDAAGTFRGFYQWRQANAGISPLIFLGEQLDSWGYPAFALHSGDVTVMEQYMAEHEMGRIFLSGIDAAIIAVAFAQLYLEGTIEEKTRDLAKIAIERQLLPALLEHWDPSHLPTRQEQLTKMLGILNRA